MGDDDADEAEDGVLGVFADDYEGGAGCHCANVGEEEEVREAPWYWWAELLVCGSKGLEAVLED